MNTKHNCCWNIKPQFTFDGWLYISLASDLAELDLDLAISWITLTGDRSSILGRPADAEAGWFLIAAVAGILTTVEAGILTAGMMTAPLLDNEPSLVWSLSKSLSPPAGAVLTKPPPPMSWRRSSLSSPRFLASSSSSSPCWSWRSRYLVTAASRSRSARSTRAVRRSRILRTASLAWTGAPSSASFIVEISSARVGNRSCSEIIFLLE